MKSVPRFLSVLCGVLIVGTAPAKARDDIHQAVRRHDLAAVRAIVAADAGALKDSSTSQTALHEAACYESAEMVKLLIELGADVNAVAYNRFTPLHVVNNAESARVLIKAGADTTLVDVWGNTPLQGLARGGNSPITDAMIELGAKVDLASAIMLGKKDLARKIVAADPASVNPTRKTSDLWGNTAPLGLAAEHGDMELVKLLVEAGARVNHGTDMPNAGGKATALSNAVWREHAEMVRYLLDKGASVDCAGGKFYDSIFDFALHQSSPEIIELLIRHGAAALPNSRNKSPLAEAAAMGNLAVVALLLKHAPKPYEAEDLRRALFLAAVGRHDGVVKHLTANNAVPDLFTSAVLGDEDAVRKAVENDPALVDAQDKQIGRSLLAWAIVADREGVARVLIEHKANVNNVTNPSVGKDELFELSSPATGGGTVWRASELETPLLAAIPPDGRSTAPKLNYELIHLLLEKGADPNVAGAMGETPLFTAAHWSDERLVKDLLAHKANPNAKGRSGTPVLRMVTDSRPVARLLLEHGADPNYTDTDGETLLEAALSWPAPGVAEELVAHGAKLTMPAACMLGRADFVRTEITRDPTLVGVMASSRFKETPLFLAALHGQADVVRVLLDGKADVNHASLEGRTALHRAAEGGDVPTARLLLDRGAMPAKNSPGGTPLHEAARRGKLEMTRFLLDNKADVNGESESGATPLDCCAWDGTAEVAELLIARGALVNHRNRTGLTTSLHGAAMSGNLAVAQALLKHGADPALRDARGHTALAFAQRGPGPSGEGREEQYEAIVRLLGGTPEKMQGKP